MDKVIGIDLGTTNSCVAIVEHGTPVVLTNRGGYKTTPSIVALTQNGKRLVGHIAKRQAMANAENTVYAAKRFIGRKWASPEVKSALATSSYRIVEGPHKDVRIAFGAETLSVPEISAMVLREMKVVAEDYLGEPVKKAVVTVPAYFNDNQRQATRDAGEIAGLDVIRIINEPTAAALSYGFGRDMEKTVAVYDFGGGTFDISILDIGMHGAFMVTATGGDTNLGGEDVDSRIVDWLVATFELEHEIDLNQDRMALQRLRDAAERAKCELSTMDETEVSLPFISASATNDALHLKRTLTRRILDELTADLIERTIDICKQTLEDEMIELDSIDEVLLVGGSTRMPQVQRAVKAFFGKEPSRGVHPDEAVAMGAAIQAAALVDDGQKVVLLDVSSQSLGIMTFGGRFEVVIPHNTTVPTNQAKTFTTSQDGQTAVNVIVMQGESEQAEENELLGEFMLTGLRRAPKGEVEIEVTFAINADGIVSVRATDVETGVEQSIQVTATSGLTRNEIEAMVREANELLDRRSTPELGDATSRRAEDLIRNIERLLPMVQKSVASSEFGREAVQKGRTMVQRARAALERKDIAALEQQIDELARTERVFARYGR